MFRTLFAAAMLVALSLSAPAVEPVATATEIGPVSKLPMPRFVSLRSGEVNVRRGPGLDYRKDWVFHRAGLPVQVVDEYGDWRRIVDQDGAGGWVYHSLLSGRRTVMVNVEMAVLRDRPVETAVPVAEAEHGVVATLRECEDRWCLVEIERVKGWVLKKQVWGADGAPG